MDKNSLGFKIKYYRKLSKLTQEELAVMVELNNSTISRYEKGNGFPTIENLYKIAKALKVDVDDLITDYVKKQNVNFENLNEFLFDVLEELPSLSINSQEAYLKMIQNYKDIRDKNIKE